MSRFILFTILAVCVYGGYNHYKEKNEISERSSKKKIQKNITPKLNQEIPTPDQSSSNGTTPSAMNTEVTPTASEQLTPPPNDFVENPGSEPEQIDPVDNNPQAPVGSPTENGNGIVPEENPNSSETSPKDASPNSLVSCQTQIKNCEPKESQQYDDPNTNTFCITYAYNCLSPDSIQRVWKEEEVFRPQVEPSSDTVAPVDDGSGYNMENPPEVQEPAEPVYDEAPQYQEPSDDMNY